jgi:hypothetical protein
MSANKLVCPECGCENLLVTEETSWWVNSGDFFCHSVKTHDDEAKVRCHDNSCEWVGQRSQLVAAPEKGQS